MQAVSINSNSYMNWFGSEKFLKAFVEIQNAGQD
jgi:hypothetical protein